MQVLEQTKISSVTGGNAMDSVSGSFIPEGGAACANAILFWSGVGAAVGAFGGGISAIGGFAIGGGYGATRTICVYQN